MGCGTIDMPMSTEGSGMSTMRPETGWGPGAGRRRLAMYELGALYNVTTVHQQNTNERQSS